MASQTVEPGRFAPNYWKAVAKDFANSPKIKPSSYQSDKRALVHSEAELRTIVRTLRAICKDKKAKAELRYNAACKLIELKGYGPQLEIKSQQGLAELADCVKSDTVGNSGQ